MLKDDCRIIMPKLGLLDSPILEKTGPEVVFDLLNAFFAFKDVKLLGIIAC